MILLKLVFLLFILLLVITLTIEMWKEDKIQRKIGHTIIIIALLLMWLYILLI